MPSCVNFGIVSKQTDRVVDIIVENNSDKKDFLLRSNFSHEFETRYSSKTIEPNGNIVIRIKFNPRKQGPFEERIELFFASMQKPVVFLIRANVMYVDVNDGNPCPDFSERAADCCSQNMFIVEVVDRISQEPIEKALVKIEEQGVVQLKIETNKEGLVSQEAKIGYYDIFALKEGYRKASIESYINKRNNRFRIELERDPNFALPENDGIEGNIEFLDTSVPDTANANTPVPLSKELPENLYRSNNIVFLLDVSSSMSVGDKLDLLKISLIQLASVLRPIDQVALISYADEAKTLLATTTGDQKDQITSIVRGIRANGTTSGAKGFKRSYDALKKHFLENGNNQLIVITDGAFKAEDQAQIEKLVKRYSRKNIRTSVVAIKSNLYAKEKLSLVSTTGNGSFVTVEDADSARSALITEIKKQSAK